MPLYPMIIPTIKKDYSRVNRNLNMFFEMLPIQEIIFIGPKEVEDLVKEDARRFSNQKIRYLNENELIPYDSVMNVIRDRITQSGYAVRKDSRLGWYYQQFLKMAFHKVCDEEYYISWDSDTIPLHKIEMMNSSGKPYFDIKPEYFPSYFKTIEALFGYQKVIPESFISEHMIFKKTYMKELIDDIENTAFSGNEFYEKIFWAIELDNMKHGFAEFETYGTWVTMRYSDAYEMRSWNSLRKGGNFFRNGELTEEDIQWLSQSFDAITFEVYNDYIPEMGALFHSTEWRNKLSAVQIYQSILESGYFGEYKGGMIKRDGVLYAV